MAGMDVSYGDQGQTLKVWFAAPWKAHHSEPSGDDLVLTKDDHGCMIGYEHRAYFADAADGIDPVAASPNP